jgi:serine/threonine protein kinase
MKHPADQLEGMKLDGGYEVRRKIVKKEGDTGGHFSVCYSVHNNGVDYFLKATDVTFFKGEGDQATRLRDALNVYTYERNLLEVARMHAMTRVVRVVAAGDISIKIGDPSTGQIEIPVFYLIFENADGSLRDRMLDTVPVEPIDKLKALQHTALGLRQLHSKEIAHQDLKPSNIVSFVPEKGDAHYKVADLGRASHRDSPALHDSLACPGDRRYAAPETLYGAPANGFDRRRVGTDAYLFGSLIAQIFTSISITTAIVAKLPDSHKPGAWNDPYDQLLPRLLEAFDEVLEDLKSDWPYKKEDPQIGAELALAVRQLCYPDPMRRGHPRALGTVDPLNLDRYVSLLAALVHRASIAERRKSMALKDAGSSKGASL